MSAIHHSVYARALKDPDGAWDLYTLRSTGLPEAWANDGAGGCTVVEEGDRVVARAFSGARRLAPGRALVFRFGLLPTPVKPLDPKHFGERYCHDLVPVEMAKKLGATIINIHHGTELNGEALNPYINYPFLTIDALAGFAREAHAAGLRVKIYYTVRELSNRVAEMFPLRSLGHEIFAGGPGGGHSWLCEHLISDYAPAWHHIFPDGRVDAAIAMTGLSRWHNYYLEGLAWLLREAEIDGLYLDGIGYDRAIMKRVRKVLDRVRPGSLIDFHSGNNFAPAYGLSSCANQYLEHFPYIDSLWFGEGFDYDESPDYWLVEISGIPFGLFGEMLQGGGHPWRGMLYGMSNRFYQGADPSPIWKLWDLFGIGDAAVIGYWDPACPVRTGRDDILATVYRKKEKALVALASWAKAPARVRLAIDWTSLGIDAERASLYAPPVRGHQPARLFEPDDPIPVAAGRGWWLILDEDAHEILVAADPRAERRVLFEETFAGARLGAEWTVARSKRPGTSIEVEEGRLAIESAANSFAFAERALPAGVTMVECRVDSGTDRGATWGPGLAVLWPSGAVRINLRAEGRFGVDVAGRQVFGGFVEPENRYVLRIRVESDGIVAEASADGDLWETIHTLPRGVLAGDPVRVRIGKMSGGASSEDFSEPGPAGACSIDDLRAYGAASR
ncbi:MAG: hypothetical protein JXP34_02175 [Planctomycetes bacterium]|nr:hypothetical protein [Planctomycetota bacterium]